MRAAALMRRAFVSCLLSGFLLGCSSQDGSLPDWVATSYSSIEWGTLDTTHQAVVMVLSQNHECSGTIVKVAPNGTAYVLTAAHCCIGTAADVPSLVIAGNDASNPTAQYPVNSGSVYYDAGYTGTSSPYDFCMFTIFAGSTAPFVPVPDPVTGDGLGLDVTTEIVGYGYTEVSTNNSRRFHGTNTIDMPVTADINLQLTYSAAGTSQTPGTCPGDSGGPTLFPPGADPSRQIVVGVHSFGGPANASCGTYTFNGDSRVLSRVGTGKFITAYLTGASLNGIGVRAGASAPVPALPIGGSALLGVLLAAVARVSWRSSPRPKRSWT